MSGEVAQRQLGECLVAVELSRGRDPVGEAGVGVGAVLSRPTAADERLELEIGEQDHQRLPGQLVAGVGEHAGELDSGQM